MKRITKIVGLMSIALIIMLSGCEMLGLTEEETKPNPQVRFENDTTGFAIYYGLKFGDAEFFFEGSDEFDPGEETSYKTTTAGSHTPQACDLSYESWSNLITNSFSVERGGKYTILFTGYYNSKNDFDITLSLRTDQSP